MTTSWTKCYYVNISLPKYIPIVHVVVILFYIVQYNENDENIGYYENEENYCIIYVLYSCNAKLINMSLIVLLRLTFRYHQLLYQYIEKIFSMLTFSSFYRSRAVFIYIYFLISFHTCILTDNMLTRLPLFFSGWRLSPEAYRTHRGRWFRVLRVRRPIAIFWWLFSSLSDRAHFSILLITKMT